MITIPKGKRLYLTKGKREVTGDIPIILEEEITLDLSSTFEPLYGGQGSKIVDILGKISKDIFNIGFSSKFKQLGFQVWTSTNPISFSATIGFYMGSQGYYDAKREVYDPMYALMALPLPSENRGGNLIAPGPSLLSLLNEEKTNYEKLRCQIGNIIEIDNVLVERAEPTFASETDDKDYPIWGKIQLTIKSVEIATVELLKSINR